MKKLLFSSVLVLGWGMQQAVCNATTQSVLVVQKDIETLIAHAQRNNLSDLEILDLAQRAVDQAARVESAELEVEQSNKRTLLIVAGVVVVVVVAGGLIYYFYNKKDEEAQEITTARQVCQEILKKMAADLPPDELREELNRMGKELTVEERAYLRRAWEVHGRRLEHAGKMAGFISEDQLFNSREGIRFCYEYIRKNLLNTVDELYERPLTLADLEKARKFDW
ncbi:hypothetical protein K2W90_05530 [Candidatus Babeliales bacterium]|nr:hypothetical protein [Candidatus Babeliales bacterium]